MAVYSKLLLSAGGGIISASQQAEQTKNTATLLIGLGGTGVHCIRTIKTQVYDRLKPDNPGAPVPVYSHIRFLGVDTTVRSKGGSLTQNPDIGVTAAATFYQSVLCFAIIMIVNHVVKKIDEDYALF